VREAGRGQVRPKAGSCAGRVGVGRWRASRDRTELQMDWADMDWADVGCGPSVLPLNTVILWAVCIYDVDLDSVVVLVSRCPAPVDGLRCGRRVAAERCGNLKKRR
jgi:ribosomal protein L11 methylase PrmA